MSPHHSVRAPFVAGVGDVAPILIGVVPFALIVGIAAVEAGLGTVQAFSVSPIVFAGASQLAIVDLLGRNAAPIVVVGTALAINARFLMYSAALAPTFRDLPALHKAFGAYVLTDQSFVVSVARFDRFDESLGDRFAYYLGASMALWITWQVATLVGVIIGTDVPQEWSLDFAIPLVFMALLFPALKDRGTTIAAIASGTAAVAFASFPLNLGLLAATGIGLIAGALGSRA